MTIRLSGEGGCDLDFDRDDVPASSCGADAACGFFWFVADFCSVTSGYSVIFPGSAVDEAAVSHMHMRY